MEESGLLITQRQETFDLTIITFS